MFSTIAMAKPAFSTVIRYSPALTVKNSKLPSAFVAFVIDTPVAVLVSVTVASGTTALLASRTVPSTVAVSNCACAVRAVAIERTMMASRGKPLHGCLLDGCCISRE